MTHIRQSVIVDQVILVKHAKYQRVASILVLMEENVYLLGVALNVFVLMGTLVIHVNTTHVKLKSNNQMAQSS